MFSAPPKAAAATGPAPGHSDLMFSAPPGGKTAPAPGGGILGGIGHALGIAGHIAAQTGGDFYSAAEHSVGGLIAAGSAAGHDVANQVLHPNTHTSEFFTKVIVPMGKGAVGDVKQAYNHPSDPHLGNLLLDAFGIASLGFGAGARLGAAGKVLTAAKDAGTVGKVVAGGGDFASTPSTLSNVAKALVTQPKAGVRTFTHEGVPVEVPASRSSLTRAAQKTVLDPLRQRFPDVPRLGAAATVQRNLGKADRAAKRVADSVPAAFVRTAKQAGLLKRTPGKAFVTYTPDALARQHALRVVAEGVPAADRIAAHQGLLDQGYKSAATNPEVAAFKEKNFTAGHQEQIALNQSVGRYVHDVNGKPQIRAGFPELQATYDEALRTLGSREKMLDAINALTPEQKAGRLSAPGNLFFNMAKQGPDKTVYPAGTLFHGSPDGELGQINALHHTKPWREGPGFYLTPNLEKAQKYAAGKTASAERRVGNGAVNPFQLKPDAKVLNMDTAPDSFWRGLAEHVTGGKVDEATWKLWSRDITPDEMKGASPGIVNRARVMHLLTGWAEMPKTDAYYALEDALHTKGYQATLHHEGGVPVYVVKDENAIHRAGSTTKPGEMVPFAGGEARIPTVPAGKEPRSKSGTPQIGTSGVVNGTPQKIPSIYQPYTGAAYRGGKIRNDVVRLINEAHQEAQRYFTLVHVTDRLKSAAKDAPTSKYDIPIRVEQLPGGASLKEARAIAEQAHNDPGKLAAFSHAYESMRQQIFPVYEPGKNWQAAAQRMMAAADEAGVPGYKFVDSRLTGNLHQRNPLLSAYDHKSLSGLLKVTDGINNASKLAILYLKPAYIAPNLIGNVAMNLTQQGFAAPVNLARAARLNASLDHETYGKVLATMGEGLTGSLETSGAGIVGKASNAGAHFYGNILGVDKYPRLAAFLYEARKLGYKTPEDLRRLYEPGSANDLNEVTMRANKAIIDYGDLGPVEQAIVRRAIFFYPWVKGATKWSVGFVADHPVQAAVGGQLAKTGKQNQQAALGSHLPMWAQALAPTGFANGLPTTVNPSGISLLSTPADLISGVLHGNAGGNAPPAISLAHDVAKDPLHFWRAAVNLAQGFPIVPAIDAAAGTHLARPSKTFPYERAPREALLLWLLGSGLVPRETNPAALEKSWYREQQQLHRR